MPNVIVSLCRLALPVVLIVIGFVSPLRAMDALWQSEILFHVNAARIAQGLAPLQWDARLAAAAAVHGSDLQTCKRLAHDGCGGSTLPQRVTGAGFSLRRASENLALCPCDAATVVRLWLGSEGHRRNLLDPDVSALGADTRIDTADLRRQQWVLVMGRE